MFDDTKGLIRNRKDRHYNGQTKKDKKTNNDLRNTTQKTKDSSFLLRVACDLNKDWKVKNKLLYKRKLTNPNILQYFSLVDTEAQLKVDFFSTTKEHRNKYSNTPNNFLSNISILKSTFNCASVSTNEKYCNILGLVNFLLYKSLDFYYKLDSSVNYVQVFYLIFIEEISLV
jgi:hypothetical protein